MLFCKNNLKFVPLDDHRSIGKMRLSFDQELNRKTPSPKKSAAKKLETKNVHRKNLNKSVAVLLGRVQILWPGNSEMPYLLAISKTK